MKKIVCAHRHKQGILPNPSWGMRGLEKQMICLLPHILNIGITGHRPNKLTPAAALIAAAQFHWVAKCMEAQARQIAMDQIKHPTPVPCPLVRLSSGLAEGADQLAARNIPPGWLLRAILPMPKARYELDFDADAGSGSRQEFARLLSCASEVIELDLPEIDFDGGSAQRAQYYEQHGRYLIGTIDLLVAVWDGDKSAGPGGTADVVGLAIDRQQPVVWIDSTAQAPPRLLFSLGPSRACHATALATEPTLAAAVAETLRVKAGGSQAGTI